MRSEPTPGHGDRASVVARLSRRTFLHIAAAGTAAALPAAAIAAASDISEPPLSDEEQLNICIGQLKNILGRMHSNVIRHCNFTKTFDDGSYSLTFQGYVAYQQFDGDGLYEISQCGYVSTFWLERRFHCHISDGTPLLDMPYYAATQWDDGRPCDDERRLYEPKIIRKITEVAI